MTLSMDRINKARQAGYADDDIVESISRRDAAFGERIKRAREAGYDSTAILQSIEKKLGTPKQDIPQDVAQNEAKKPEPIKKASYKDWFAQGLQGSATGEISTVLEKSPDQIQQDPGFWEALVQETGNITGDAPFMLAGGMLGSSVGAALGSSAGPYGTGAGAILGGGFGTFAFPEFIKTALKEYKDHVAQGNDLTFGEFLQRADKVGSKTLNSGLMGSILGMVNRAAPLLKGAPGIGKLFESKIAQKAATIGAETAAVAAIPKISQGELPEGRDFAHALALVGGFHALQIPKAIRDKIQMQGELSGMTPEEFAKTFPKDEIQNIAKIINEQPQSSSIDLAERDAKILQSTDVAKARNQADKIAIEPARNEISKREPEKVDKPTATIIEDLETTKQSVEALPKSNKKNLAREAIENGWVRTPEQLNLFLDEYEAIYEGIPGKTGLSKNRKFMNRYAEKNVESRQIKKLDTEPVHDITPSAERKLEIGRTQKREAKLEGDKTKLKEAQKRIDLSKRKLEKQTDQKTEAPEATKEDVKPKELDEHEISMPEEKTESAKLIVKPAQYSIEMPKEKKAPKPIIETTGEGAEERLDTPLTKAQKIQEKASDTLEAAKNPQEVLSQIYTKAFDALEPISRLEKDIPVEERVTTKIKQAQSAASDINNLLTQGIFDNVSNTFQSGSLRDVYVDTGNVWKKATKGLKDGEYSVREMDVYRTSKEALKRQKKGLKSGIDTAEAEADVARLKQKYGPVDQRLRQWQANILDHYGKDLLTPETRDQWSQDSHASLYRVMDYGKDAVVKEGSLAPKKPWYKAKGSVRKIIPPSESDIQNLSMLVSNAKKNDSILQYKKNVEKGLLPGKVVKSKNRAMPEKMMEELGIDPENAELAETLYNQSRKDAFTPETGRLKGWEDGKPFEIEVPLDVYETYTSLAPSDTGMLTNIFKKTNHIMSKGIVLEPIKFLSIFGRDAWSSLIYSRTGSSPLSIMKALTDIYKDSHSWNQFKSLGGEQYASRLLTRTERIGKIEELLKTERPNAIMIPFHKLGSFLREHSSNLVASVPFAEYQRAVKKYGDTPSGRLQALIEAKSVTYDPGKKGSSKLVKDAANFFPFFNVMLQEPAMIAKHMKRPMFWAKGAVGMTLPALLLKMYNEGNPDYDDMNPLLKASCFHFYTEDGHYAVPIPWLLGALFKSVPEAFYDYLKSNNPEGFKGLNSYVASQLSGSFPPIVQAVVEQSTEESLPSPAGVLMMPFADIEKRAPPVVPRRLKGLPPEQQYTAKTSQLARWWGNLWGVSPVKAERLVKTFTGGLGAKSLALIDEIAYQSGLAEDLRPEQREKNYLLLGQFVYNSTPSNTKYTQEFYNRLEGSKIDKKRGESNDYKMLQSYNTKISKLLKDYRNIEDQRIDPKRKKQLLEKKQNEINALYKEAVIKTN